MNHAVLRLTVEVMEVYCKRIERANYQDIFEIPRGDFASNQGLSKVSMNRLLSR
jgi:hypothetical protein